MRTENFDFNIGTSPMPKDPAEFRGRRRENGRMVVLDRASTTVEHTVFENIYDYLQPGDLLVLNDSYMLSNDLTFTCEGESVQVIICGYEPNDACIVEVRPAQHARPGMVFTSANDAGFTCTLIEAYPDKLWKAKFIPADRLIPILDEYGLRADETIPLDPVHWRSSPEAYRSVYAKRPGSLEIPSAGLHFSADLLNRLVAKGIELAYITLHVAATEILAVRHIHEEEIEKHKVRPEYFEVGAKTAEQLSRAKAEGRRVVAVGTTVMRTLETLALDSAPGAPVAARSGWSALYIYPGFRFKIVDALLTNLHRPRSSHIVLTAAFAGQELVMRSYAEIIDRGEYEFDMFGDSMLII